MANKTLEQIKEEARLKRPAGFLEVASGKLRKDDLIWNTRTNDWDKVKMDGECYVEQTYITVREVKF